MLYMIYALHDLQLIHIWIMMKCQESGAFFRMPIGDRLADARAQLFACVKHQISDRPCEGQAGLELSLH